MLEACTHTSVEWADNDFQGGHFWLIPGASGLQAVVNSTKLLKNGGNYGISLLGFGGYTCMYVQIKPIVIVLCPPYLKMV